MSGSVDVDSHTGHWAATTPSSVLIMSDRPLSRGAPLSPCPQFPEVPGDRQQTGSQLFVSAACCGMARIVLTVATDSFRVGCVPAPSVERAKEAWVTNLSCTA
jgi:hypothetical protein